MFSPLQTIYTNLQQLPKHLIPPARVANQWLPFEFNTSEIASDPVGIDNACTTWSWQGPECLVEFRRQMETLSDERGGQAEAQFEYQ